MDFGVQNNSIEGILILSAVLLLLSLVTSRVTKLVGIPALLVFLTVGMLAGSEGIGGIYFDDARLSQGLSIVALAFILFYGGLSTSWPQIRPVFWQGLSLATIGVVVSTAIVGLCAGLLFELTPVEALLVGATISSTDAAAVFSILRSKSLSLRRLLTPLLELESGINDPMAVFLTIVFTQLALTPETSGLEWVSLFFQQMALGTLLGFLAGKAAAWAVNYSRLEHEGLYPVLTLSVVALTYGLTSQLNGSGFLAVYVTGITLGNSQFLHKRSLTAFHDGVAWLMQLAMFLTLGLLVFPSHLIKVTHTGMIIAFVLMLVARPISVWVSLFFSSYSAREKLFISWAGLRGATPIILATFPLIAGIPRAPFIFNVVFFVVITSVLFQGPSLIWAARLLGVRAFAPRRRPSPLIFEPITPGREDLIEILIQPDFTSVGKRIVDLGLPKGALAVLVHRGENYFVPGGGTVLEAGDVIIFLCPKSREAEIRACLRGPQPTDPAD